ncbi:FAD-binding oxidoreductase [Sporosarcina sp. G11-34]|nr:FAD-binding oxidoreductase [Sporosarcina sp. G11-34]
MHDVSRLFPAYVKEIVQGREEEALIAAVKIARDKDLKISIAGSKHSQGGHAFYKDSVWLDMSTYNKILELDEDRKTITVQSGTTWKQIQDFINPYGLSIKVMQSSNIFTVGGSLSSNVHGRDPKYGTIIETIDSFRLLTADGHIKKVSRTENEELFPLVIGGYGLFGVILDVTIQLTDDVLYVSEIEKIDYKKYPDYFAENILSDDATGLHYARLSITPNSLFDEMYMTTFKVLEDGSELYPTNEEYKELTTLQNEKSVKRNKFLFDLSRKYDWGKNLSWYIQNKFHVEKNVGKITSRNNTMRPLVEFLEYDASNKTDILQEYFIPTAHFAHFVDELRLIVEEEELNLLNATIRYTKATDEGFLTYANEDTFAFVLTFNHPLTEKGIAHMEQATRKIIDSALSLNGTYYLTYQLFANQQQIRGTYPNIDDFFEKKRLIDPDERFMNSFYEKYNQNGS